MKKGIEYVNKRRAIRRISKLGYAIRIVEFNSTAEMLAHLFNGFFW